MCPLFGVQFLKRVGPAHFWNPRAPPTSTWVPPEMYLSGFTGHAQYVHRPHHSIRVAAQSNGAGKLGCQGVKGKEIECGVVTCVCLFLGGSNPSGRAETLASQKLLTRFLVGGGGFCSLALGFVSLHISVDRVEPEPCWGISWDYG